MKNLWITYAWKDNEDKDIDFIIQELESSNIKVNFDRRNLIPGQRLWEQIGELITDPNQCDAWAIVLTQNSLNSENCIEELSYALDRALNSNGEKFPMFALLHKISSNNLPPALKIRLCITLENNNWVEQVVAAVEKKSVGFSPSDIEPFIITVHKNLDGIILEIRPRFERISPFVVAVDYEQKINENVTICMPGPANMVPNSFTAFNWINGQDTLPDGTKIWVWGADNEANSTSSYYLFSKKMPPRIWFGHKKNIKCYNLKRV